MAFMQRVLPIIRSGLPKGMPLNLVLLNHHPMESEAHWSQKNWTTVRGVCTSYLLVTMHQNLTMA